MSKEFFSDSRDTEGGCASHIYLSPESIRKFVEEVYYLNLIYVYVSIIIIEMQNRTRLTEWRSDNCASTDFTTRFPTFVNVNI